MALEAVPFLQHFLSHSSEQLYPMAGGQWIYELAGEVEEDGNGLLASECEASGVWVSSNGGAGMTQEPRWGVFDGVHGTWDLPCSSTVQRLLECDMTSSSPRARTKDGADSPVGAPAPTAAGCRRKRRRTRSCKNEEEVANQRMTHIAVERNRRKQMNEHLAALRSLMPSFYVQKGDQASIVGGAINFVKELEQLLQSLEAQKRVKHRQQEEPPAEAAHARAAADVEVRMVDCHANLKVLSRRRPQQLVRLVAGLQGLRLTTLHINVTTADQMVFYSFSLKVEDDCQLSSVEGIANAVRQMLGRIQEETGF